MSRTELTLVRIVDRIGQQRLSTDPTLARTSLKDLFPDDPLIVSLLTAAVEHGVLGALIDDDRQVPLSALGPRLAVQLRRDSGIADASARWAVAAWAAGLGRLPRPLPDLEGVESAASEIFGAPAATVSGPTRPGQPSEVSEIGEATLVDPTTGTTEIDADGDQDGSGDEVTEHDLTSVEDDGRADDETRVADVARPADKDAASASATATVRDEDTDDETVRRERPNAAVDAPAAQPDPAGETPPDDVLDLSGDEDTVMAAPPAETPRVTTVVPGSPRPRRRRRSVILVAAAAVLVLAAAGITALVLRPSAALAVAQDSSPTSWLVAGRTTAVAAGATVPQHATVDVASTPIELHAGGSVVRLAIGAHARVDGPTSITVLSGEAFVLAAGTPITLHTSAGTATVSTGRALAGCATTCTVTAVDAGTVVRDGQRTTTLRALQQIGSGAASLTLPDAVRVDPWFAANDALDRKQGRTPLGVEGVSVLGSWLVSMTRPDLPFNLMRTIKVVKSCTADGCSVHAETSMSDAVGTLGKPLTGTVRALAADGSRIAIDYGSHKARCHWQIGLKPGQGIDGAETVGDELDFHGAGASQTVSGSRTTVYTTTQSACSAASYTAKKIATISGARGAAAQLTDAAAKARAAEQQLKLNYIADQGTGCVTGSATPTADRQADLRCSFTAHGTDPTSVEFGMYKTPDGLGSAYRTMSKGLAAPGTGDCATGPCEQVAPNHHGRFLLQKDADGAVLITYDPRAANLLVVAHGPSMRGLSAWWSAQQGTPSTYQSFPIRRVGV